MFISPDWALTWEETLGKVWRESLPEAQADYHEEMAATGKTWDPMCREAQEGFLKKLAEAKENPDCPFARYLVFRETPYGKDPLLRKNP